MLTAWMLAAALHTAAGRVPAADPTVHEIDTPHFRIPVSLARYRPDGAKEVLLYVSTDRGATWARHAAIPATEPAFEFHAGKPGEYWFTPVVVRADGTRDPKDVGRPETVLKVRVVADDPAKPGRKPREKAAAPAKTFAAEVDETEAELNRTELELIRKELKRLAEVKEFTPETGDQFDRLRSRLHHLKARVTPSPDLIPPPYVDGLRSNFPTAPPPTITQPPR
jgi:hypothetical protein